EFQLPTFQDWRRPAQDLFQELFNARSRRRAPGQDIVDVNGLVRRRNAGQESRHDSRSLREGGGLSPFGIHALEDTFAARQAKLIADRRDIASYGAIPEGHQRGGSSPDGVKHLEVVLIADRAFNEAKVNLFRIILDVQDRAVNEVHPASQID